MKRKIVEQGGLTLMISLPREWTKKQSLKKGDELEIKEAGKQLLLTPDKRTAMEKVEIDITNLDRSLLWRYFGAAYRKGCEEIKLNFKQNCETIQEVQRMISRFIGMELIEQGKDFYLVRELTAVKPEEFKSMLRKTFQLLISMSESMLSAAKTNDKEALQNLKYTDHTLNKFADYCFRILNQKGYKNPQKTTAYHTIVKQLEEIGDDYKKLGEEIARTRIKDRTVEMINELNQQLKKFYQLFYEFDETQLLKLSKQQKSINKRITNLPDKTMTGYLKKINTTIIDMTDAMVMIRL